MRIVLLPPGAREVVYSQADPDWSNESAFEIVVAEALARVYARYSCIVFDGGFSFQGRVFRPDLALVAKDFSHWFVIEVELLSHSLLRHVLPQVRAFQFGQPQEDCVPKLATLLGIGAGQARTLLEYVPRSTGVVVNRASEEWRSTLAAIEVQISVVSRLTSASTASALEVDGLFEVLDRHLGFGVYSAADRSIRFPLGTELTENLVQLVDPTGQIGSWVVRAADDGIWATKEIGAPPIREGCFVQLRRNAGGELHLRSMV